MIKTRLVGLLSHAKKYIVYTVLWQWAALLSQIVAVFSIARLLEKTSQGTLTSQEAGKTAVILLAVVLVRFFCERMQTQSSYLACVDVKRILREKIYEKMLRLGASYREQVSSSEVVQVSTEGVEQLETYFGKYLPQLFYSLLAPITLFLVLSRVCLKASVTLLVCVPLIPISIVVVQKIAKRLLNKYWSIYTGLGDSFLENLQGLTTLKIYQADQLKADEMDAGVWACAAYLVAGVVIPLWNGEETILNDYSINLEPGKITGIHGPSGCGKSTLLKLLMRFWDVQKGEIQVDGRAVMTIPTRKLRDMESYVTQETQLFHDSIANNIAVAKPGASRKEIMEAAKKASLHEFIMTLPKGYDTEVGELGDTLSGGEKQRIGIARAFLHDTGSLVLMDEPISNLDSLNEGIILKSLKESAKTKTVVLVSHRTSTMQVADVVYEMENGRIS